MKILKKTAFESDWGRFVWKDIPAGYKAGAEISVQQQEYTQLWEETKDKLKDLTEETVLAGVSKGEAFDVSGKDLISTQVARMLGEAGTWEKMGDFPKTKFVMKKLTEQGIKINNPQSFIGKKLSIENGQISIVDTNSSTETVESEANGENVIEKDTFISNDRFKKVSFAEEIMNDGSEVLPVTPVVTSIDSTYLEENSTDSLPAEGKDIVIPLAAQVEKEVPSEEASSESKEGEQEVVEKSLEEMIFEKKVSISEFWSVKGTSEISKKVRRFGFAKTVENLSVTTTGGKSALFFDDERLLITENAETILKNLQEAAAMDNEMIEEYWNKMARLGVSRKRASNKFDKYEELLFDLPVDVSFNGITKAGHNFILKKGSTRIDVSFDSESGTYVIDDISRRTNLDKISYAKKIDKRFSSEDLIQLLKKENLNVEIDKSRE